VNQFDFAQVPLTGEVKKLIFLLIIGQNQFRSLDLRIMDGTGL